MLRWQGCHFWYMQKSRAYIFREGVCIGKYGTGLQKLDAYTEGHVWGRADVQPRHRTLKQIDDMK